MRIFPCPDQILQIDGSGENTLFIYHIDGHDIVVFSGLLYQLAHSLPDGQVLRDTDVVRRHAAADLFFIIGQRRSLSQHSPQTVPGYTYGVPQCI